MRRFSPEVKALAGEVQRKILEQVTDKTDPRYLALVKENLKSEPGQPHDSSR